VEVGVNLVEMKKGIDMAVVSIVEELRKVAIPVEGKEQIKSVATISANGD
jgi:chaperonin GroEL